MKILFVVHDLGFADHVAVAYLSSIAKELGHSTFFVSLDHEKLSTVVDRVRPDVIGYSVNIIGYQKTLAAHKEALKIHKFVSIMGGPHPTFAPETFLESGMDAYCIGEGEYVFRDFLKCIESGKPIDNVENIITRKKSNPLRPLIADLDKLPMPDRDLVIANSFLKHVGKKTFYATRGCPFECSYCCNSYYHKLYKGKGPIVRRFSPERVICEIEDVRRKYRMDFVKFGDDLFVARADDWISEFAEKYAKRIDIPFNCYLRFDIVDDALLKLLKQAGCYSVHLSVDSTSKYVREVVLKRRMRSEKVLENLRKIRSYKINTWVNYMLAAPGSSLQDDLDTLKMSRAADVTYPSYTTTVPTKGTELYNYCIDNRLIDFRDYKGDMSGCMEKSSLLCFTEKDKKIRYNIYLLGALIAKLPQPFYMLALFLIRVIPPNRFFKKVRKLLYRYYIENKIYKIGRENRMFQRQKNLALSD